MGKISNKKTSDILQFVEKPEIEVAKEMLKSEYDFFIRRLLTKTGQFYLSQAALETLSIIAYKQPISRTDIESIRGVDCAGVIKTLLKKTLIKISGREETTGRPLIYKTTDTFLKSFGKSVKNPSRL